MATPTAIGRSIAVIILGVVFPIAVLAQAYWTISGLTTQVEVAQTPEQMMQTFREAKTILKDGNDYKLLSMLYLERGNQKVVFNKQVLKISVMQIGFAVMSIGLMFIVLGFNEGGAEVGAETGSVKFNFKSASTGLVAFAIGAVVAATGGIIPNEYTTLPIPSYALGNSTDGRAIAAYRDCRVKYPKDDEFENCFADIFRQLNPGALR